LIGTKTEFLVVGGYALAHHGCPRFTGDIDVLVRVNPENAAKVVEAFARFGFGALGVNRRTLSRKAPSSSSDSRHSESTSSRRSTVLIGRQLQ